MAVIRTTFQDTAAFQAALDSAEAAGANVVAVLNQGGGALSEFANGAVITSRTNTRATGFVNGGGTFVLDGSGFLRPPATITHLRYNDNSPVATIDFFTNITVSATGAVTGTVNRLVYNSTNLDFDFLGSINIQNPAVTRISSLSVAIAGPTVVRSSFQGAVTVNNGVFSGTVTATSLKVDGQYLRATGLSNVPYSVLDSNDANLITMTLLSGNDTIFGKGLNQTLDGFGGNDTLNAGLGNDILNGGDGNDTLNGGAGIDTLLGGAGDDIYIHAGAADTIVENPDEGSDTIRAAETFTLPDASQNIENLTLTGLLAINGTGNNLANVLTGNAAANVLTGGTGDDTLIGGAGNDQLVGGEGNDTYVIGQGTDVLIENPDEGTDTVRSNRSVTLNLAPFTEIENAVLTGMAAINATGDSGDNLLTGNAAANVLTGGAGDDTLTGGAGLDRLRGGLGDDLYLMSVGDVIVENSGEGTDTVQSAITHTLGAHFENLTLTGLLAINGTGNDLANVLTGNAAANMLTGGAGDDTLTGGDGNDTLNGGAGIDTLLGGAGDDIYIHNGVADTIVENPGEGSDTIRAAVSFTLPDAGQNIENLTLTGLLAMNGTGNDLANVLTGNAAANVLTGGAGDDTLIGGVGNDQLTGGDGNDVYVIGPGADVLTENLNEGTDTVHSAITHTLGANFEKLTLTGLLAINGTGNDLANVLTGNAAANVLTGGAGDDRLTGGLGNDQLIGGESDDTIIGGMGVDNLQGGIGNDLILLASAAEFAAGERITGGDGIDTLRYTGNAPVTLTLTSHVASMEHVQIADPAGDASGTAAINVNAVAVVNGLNITGNAGNNVLTGTAQADTISAGAGMDSVNGRGGDDVIEFGSSDYVAGELINGGAGADTIRLTGAGQTLDLTAIPNADISNIEIIDLAGGGNRLNLAAADVLAINSTHILRVDGSVGDTVNAGSGWSFDRIVNDGGQTYAQFVQGGALLQINTDISHDIEIAIQLSALDGTNGFQVSGKAVFDYSGRSVSAAGDVNGDGFDDLVIGAPYADPNGFASGASYVVFGQAAGFPANLNLAALDGANGFQLSGEAVFDRLGWSVSAAGDVNGDGFDDLLVGAFGADPNGGDSGASYVVFGKASGFSANVNLSSLNGANGFQLSGEAFLDGSGGSVSAAGDVNGDGFADLLIGAPNADLNGNGSGASYVVFGRDFRGEVDFLGTSGSDTLTGTAENEILIGGLGNDTLTGGAGDDRLAGGLGNDLYQINRGDGQDIITENDSTPVNNDRLLYGATINPSDLVLSRQVNDLRIALHGTTERVTIDNWYADPATAQVETIQAGNGQVLLNTQVDQLIQAMATFSQQNGGLTWDQLIDQQPQQVQAVLAANWQS